MRLQLEHRARDLALLGHAKNGDLSVLQKSFIAHFAFQCGYCTPGFLNEGQVLLECLAKTPVARTELEKTIAQALDGGSRQ